MNDENLDIEIGEEKMIKWIFIDTGSDAVYDADPVLDKYREFWQALQHYCVADCCGISAYRFYPSDIHNAAKEIDAAKLKNDLEQLQQTLLSRNEDIISSNALNHLMDKKVFLQLIAHITGHL
jgi:hypothetical protein